MLPEIDRPPDGRFLVVGCGSIGKRHLGNLQQLGVTDIGAFDVQEERRREVADRFHVPVYDALDRALEGCRAALICSPTRLHLEHALRAAGAGCHLFIEKPVADSLNGLDRLVDLVREKKRITLVGCNFRFHPGLRLVKDLLSSGVIGTVVSARAQFGQYLPDWHPWEDYRQGYSARRDLGGGVLLDRIHELDYVRWLLGEVTEVHAMAGRLSHLEIETEDTVELLLRFANHAFGSIHLDYVRRVYDCHLEVIGEQGIIQWTYQDHGVRWYLASEACWQSRQWPRYDGNEMYRAEMRHWLRALHGQEAPELDVVEGARVLEIALAARQAAEQGGMAV